MLLAVCPVYLLPAAKQLSAHAEITKSVRINNHQKLLKEIR
jgi:hypothetical protein